jgi:predicted aldo/keto reductase-like oxidoreductase
MNVSVLGFGGSEIGYERASLASVSKLLNRALDAGLNVIDTAGCYGTSEECLSQQIIMISHQAVGVGDPPISIGDLDKDFRNSSRSASVKNFLVVAAGRW